MMGGGEAEAGELVEMGEWRGETVRGGWLWVEKWKDVELAAVEDEPDIEKGGRGGWGRRMSGVVDCHRVWQSCVEGWSSAGRFFGGPRGYLLLWRGSC